MSSTLPRTALDATSNRPCLVLTHNEFSAARLQRVLSFPVDVEVCCFALQVLQPLLVGDAAINDACQSDWLIFPSPSSIEMFFTHLSNSQYQPLVAKPITFGVVGQTSQQLLLERLQTHGSAFTFAQQPNILCAEPSQQNAEGLLQKLLQNFLPAELPNQSVTVVCGLDEQGRISTPLHKLQQGLRTAGVQQLQTLALYQRQDRTLQTPQEIQTFAQRLSANHRWWFASSHTVQIFANLVRQHLPSSTGHALHISAVASHPAIIQALQSVDTTMLRFDIQPLPLKDL